MDELYAEFGRRIRRCRKSRSLSQDDLALLTHMGRATIASIEKGRQAVALHQALSLCKALEVELLEMIPGNKEGSSSVYKELKGVLDGQDLEIVEQLHEAMR